MAALTAFWLPRDFMRVHGPDAASWLQGQLSQDLDPLVPGSAALSFLLQPQGKVEALIRVQRLSDDDFVIDVDGGLGDVVSQRLLRFKLRVKADVEALAWTCLAVRGPGAEALDEGLDATWLRWPGRDLIGDEPLVPDAVPIGSPADYERARIAAGVPVMGAEITDRTIPAELGPWVMGKAVSFTKGCYTGQELVARIESRGGHVPRRLRALTSDGPLGVGAALTVGDKTVGEVTSATTDASGATVALGFVGRDVEPPATVTAGDFEVRVSSLEDEG